MPAAALPWPQVQRVPAAQPLRCWAAQHLLVAAALPLHCLAELQAACGRRQAWPVRLQLRQGAAQQQAHLLAVAGLPRLLLTVWAEAQAWAVLQPWALHRLRWAEPAARQGQVEAGVPAALPVAGPLLQPLRLGLGRRRRLEPGLAQQAALRQAAPLPPAAAQRAWGCG
jgi:hypothetical protein